MKKEELLTNEELQMLKAGTSLKGVANGVKPVKPCFFGCKYSCRPGCKPSCKPGFKDGQNPTG